MKRRYIIGLLCLFVSIMASGCAHEAAVVGLRPEYPKNLVSFSEIKFVRVDSLQPTLRWEAFPRRQDRETDSEGLLSKIGTVTYELKIWRSSDDYIPLYLPFDLVYSRQGLVQPSHRIEQPLQPKTKYAWSVRACFELDGQPRVTEWGLSRKPPLFPVGFARSNPLSPRRSPSIPNPNYYRFKTSSK